MVLRVDVYEVEDQLVVEAEVPGLESAAIEITMRDWVLTIRTKARRLKNSHGEGWRVNSGRAFALYFLSHSVAERPNGTMRSFLPFPRHMR